MPQSVIQEMNVRNDNSYPPYVKTIIVLTKDLGFPVLVSGVLFYAMWHFGIILVNDHLDLIHSIKLNNEKQTETITYLADSDKENKKVLSSLIANQSLIIEAIRTQTATLVKLTEYSIKDNEKQKEKSTLP